MMFNTDPTTRLAELQYMAYAARTSKRPALSTKR